MMNPKSIKVDEEVYRKFKATCVEEGKKIYECLNDALKEYIQNHQK